MPTRRATRATNPLLNFALAVAILGCVGGLLVGTAGYLGWLDSEPDPPSEPSREGMIAVPRSLTQLRAFEVVEREDVYDLERGDDSYYWFPVERVEGNPDWKLNVSDIIGRVMARDKRPDFVFTEKDFLPEGSRPGIAAGVPEGKQGFFLTADQVPGLRLLKMGDRFDLLASLPEEAASAGAEFGLLVGGVKVRGNKPIPLNGVRLLVQGGLVVALTKGREITTQGGLALESSNADGRRTTNTSTEQLTIAIDPEEVVPLTQALGSKLSIHAVARTGRTNEEFEPRDELAGLIPFPAAALPLKAYARIRATDLAEPLTGEPRQYYFRPDAVPANWIRSVDELLGRVVRRDIDPGYIFSESDFLPPDSVMRDVKAYQRVEANDLTDPSAVDFVGRVYATDLSAGQSIRESDLLPRDAAPGIAGGIPLDRMAVTVSASKVTGVANLSRGDRFDIVASVPFDIRAELGSDVQFAGRLTSNISQKAVNTVLVTEAIVVQQSENNATLAVRPEEVPNLTKAFALSVPIFAVTRSGRMAFSSQDAAATERPTGGVPALPTDSDPMEGIAVTELFIGGKRTVSAFRRPVDQ